MSKKPKIESWKIVMTTEDGEEIILDPDLVATDEDVWRGIDKMIASEYPVTWEE